MTTKKAQKSISDIEDLSNDSFVFSENEDDGLSPKSPIRVRNKDYSFLESTKHKPKAKNTKNLKLEIKEEFAELSFEGISIKLDNLQDEPVSLLMVNSDRSIARNQFLEINEDIKSYYQLLDTIEILDALIIKYCKDPLLETIMLEMQKGKKSSKGKVKFEENREQNVLKREEIEKNENLIFEDDSKMDEENSFENKDKNIKENEESNHKENENIEIFNEPQNNLKFEENSNSILSENEYDDEIEHESILKIEEKENEDQQEELKIEDLSMKNLGELLCSVAVFVDQFSATQFKKLFQLKRTLSLIQKSVDKSVKNQLDAFHAKQRINEGGHQRKKAKHNKNEEDDDDYHVCRVCWLYFDNGHQLGGHMSKKHPGHSLEYRNKELIKTRKIIERQRRLYFKMIQHSSLNKKHVNSKRICKKMKIESHD